MEGSLGKASSLSLGDGSELKDSEAAGGWQAEVWSEGSYTEKRAPGELEKSSAFGSP